MTVGDHKFHPHRRRMPPARDQSAIGRTRGRVFIDMKGLRVILLRERDDVLLGESVGTEGDLVAERNILEPHHKALMPSPSSLMLSPSKHGGRTSPSRGTSSHARPRRVPWPATC